MLITTFTLNFKDKENEQAFHTKGNGSGAKEIIIFRI